jgi:hypothetical protein
MSRSRKKDYPKIHDSRRFDWSCRHGGSCSYCRRNRLHFDAKARSKADLTEQSNEWFGYWGHPDPTDVDMSLSDELGEKFGIDWRDA